MARRIASAEPFGGGSRPSSKLSEKTQYQPQPSRHQSTRAPGQQDTNKSHEKKLAGKPRLDRGTSIQDIENSVSMTYVFTTYDIQYNGTIAKEGGTAVNGYRMGIRA